MKNYLNKLFQSFTITILPSNVEKNVSRVKLPNYIIPLTLLIFIIPIISLIYYVDKTQKLAEEKINQIELNEKLSSQLSLQTTQSEKLLSKVSTLEENASKVKNQLDILDELELELRDHLEGLPVDIPGTGGLDIPLEEENEINNEMMLHNTIESEDPILNLTSNLNLQSDLLIDRFNHTLSIVEETSEEMDYIPTKWPLNTNFVTSDFGKRSDPFSRRSAIHTGIDVRGSYGDPVYASANGTVILASYNGGYGNSVKLQHRQSYESLYAHLSSYTVKKGEKVKKGDIIGYVGSTGRSTGPHLHFEIMKNGEYIHPKQFIDKLN